ncbi:hypothetical protein DBR32_04305 [Taibaiella sp. KBW10]|nr:hypothetical protein DBR32_04305 [Taibaiella sp. KBW10]
MNTLSLHRLKAQQSKDITQQIASSQKVPKAIKENPTNKVSSCFLKADTQLMLCGSNALAPCLLYLLYIVPEILCGLLYNKQGRVLLEETVQIDDIPLYSASLSYLSAYQHDRSCLFQ